MAVAAKAYALKSLGYEVPTITTVDPRGVGAHWVSDGGWTNGHHLLGTPPDKDVGFPYRTRLTQSPQENLHIDAALTELSWMRYLISQDTYAEWIDRGHPCPTHEEWAQYLQWVAHTIDMAVVPGRITAIRATHTNRGEGTSGEPTQWECEIALNDGGTTMLNADGVMITGPGPSTRRLSDAPGVLSISELWKQMEDGTFPLRQRVAVIGSGESAASVVDQLAHMPCDEITIYSPAPTVYSRGESIFENRLYTDPTQWRTLTLDERRDFIRRTDRGVFSQRVQNTVKNYGNINHQRGRVTDITPHDGALILHIQDNDLPTAAATADIVVDARGADPLWFTELVPNQTSQCYAEHIVTTGTVEQIAENIGTHLHVAPPPCHQDGVSPAPVASGTHADSEPWLFLPTLSALSQGPGFANLSCLGEVSDRILGAYDIAHHTP